jgi:hypothetical protein
MLQGCLDEIHKLPNHKIRPRLYMVLRHLILWAKPMYFFIVILGIFWRLFEWKMAHLGLFSDGPLRLYENLCPFPHIYFLLAVIRTRILFS